MILNSFLSTGMDSSVKLNLAYLLKNPKIILNRKRVCRLVTSDPGCPGIYQISNTENGREHMYRALLSAVLKNDIHHLEQLFLKTRDLLSSKGIEDATSILWFTYENIDVLDQAKISTFCKDSLFNKSDMIASLLQYAVLCCHIEIVEYLLTKVDNVSSMSMWWCPFLPTGLSCTALWLAASRRHAQIVNLLLDAGASPYETCTKGGNINYDFKSTILAMCEDNLPVRAVLESHVNMGLTFSVPLPLVTQIMNYGSEWMVEFLKSTFRWKSVVADEFVAVQLMVAADQSCSFLQLPCFTEEDIVRKQTICVRMLVHVIQWWHSTCQSLLDSGWLATTIKDLVRHGAMVCGVSDVESRRFLAHQSLLCGTELIVPAKKFAPPDYVAPSSRVFPKLLAPCASSHPLLPSTTSVPYSCDILYPPEGNWKREAAFGMPYFWLGLEATRSIESPVVQELFNCGALPHVEVLDSVPFSARPKKLHDGPTCQCEGVELSAAQQKMSVADLFIPPNIVPTLQASCRSTIRDCCHGHGVIPAIRRLPLPQKMIEYLSYNISRLSPLFRH